MNTSLNQGSARIYQFPAGGRSALGGRRYDEVKSAGALGDYRLNAGLCSDSWYHEAAIQEANAKPTSKPTWES
jgi:Protein of unknown function (DUF2735)